MSIRIFVDGKIGDESSGVPVLDRGFLYGDSVYEVTRTSGGRCVDLDRHLDRLERSAAAILLPPTPRAHLVAAIHDTLAAATNPESYVRVIVTRGAGEINLDPAAADQTRVVVIVKPLALPDAAAYQNGVSVAVVDVLRNPRRALDPAVKSGNYLNNIMALASARKAGAYESIMCNPEGRLVEGSTTNVFMVKDGALITPAFEDGLLDGITRRRVLELCADAELTAGEAHLTAGDLRGADEAFLTSSIRGVLPITSVDGKPLGNGKPGVTTLTVMEKYAAFLARVAVGEV
jgi:branched-chain amino acid aminotransferase